MHKHELFIYILFPILLCCSTISILTNFVAEIRAIIHNVRHILHEEVC